MAGRIVFLGKLADAAGAAGLDMPVLEAGTRLSILQQQIEAERPALADALREDGVRVALNHEILPLGSDPQIAPGDEVAFMPAMSGG